jgi:sugar phosphate isomerase/epimerase
MSIAGSTLLYTRFSLEEACRRLADLGFEAVDVAAIEDWAHFDPSAVVGTVDATVDRIESICAETGLTPVAFNANCGVTGTETEVDRLQALAEIADALDVPIITLPGGDLETPLADDHERFERLVAAIEPFDVELTVEVHWNTHLEDPSVAATYGAIDGLGLTLDPGHLAIGPHWGSPGYDPLLEFVRHVHVRQAGDGWDSIQAPPEDGTIDVDALLEDLGAVGYDGAVSVEYIDSLDGVDPDEAERHAAAMRRRLVGRLAE